MACNSSPGSTQVRFELRRGNSAQWGSPTALTLLCGEPGWDYENKILKIVIVQYKFLYVCVYKSKLHLSSRNNLEINFFTFKKIIS